MTEVVVAPTLGERRPDETQFLLHGLGYADGCVRLNAAVHPASERDHARTQASFLSLSADATQVLIPNSGHYQRIERGIDIRNRLYDRGGRSRLCVARRGGQLHCRCRTGNRIVPAADAGIALDAIEAGDRGIAEAGLGGTHRLRIGSFAQH